MYNEVVGNDNMHIKRLGRLQQEKFTLHNYTFINEENAYERCSLLSVHSLQVETIQKSVH